MAARIPINELPLRDALSPADGAPAGSAWFWGPEDQLGRLNLLTPERVRAAAAQIRSGKVVPLNVPFDFPSPPCFGRQTFQHRIVRLDAHAFDEVYVMNPQTGSQWDGFRHFAHVPSGYFYNKTTAEQIEGPQATSKCGVHAWAEHGIVGRGILLDFARYAELKNITPTMFDNYSISYDTLVEVGKRQGLDLRKKEDGGDVEVGDILLVRTGFMKHSRSISDQERATYHLRTPVFGPEDGQRYIGLEQNEKMLEFLHNSYFSAVAADNPAFEAWPSHAGYYLHEHLLALWGVPIGELWDLEKLAGICELEKRWIFMLSSAPNNVRGGIGSTSNAIAIL